MASDLEIKRDLFLPAGKPNQKRRIEDSCSLFTLCKLVAEILKTRASDDTWNRILQCQ